MLFHPVYIYFFLNFLSSSFFSPILFFVNFCFFLFASNFAAMKPFLLGNKSIYTLTKLNLKQPSIAEVVWQFIPRDPYSVSYQLKTFGISSLVICNRLYLWYLIWTGIYFVYIYLYIFRKVFVCLCKTFY